MALTGVTVPLWCSLSFDTNGRLLTGADIEGVAAMLAGLRVDAIGMNCGREPQALYGNVERLCACSPLPVFVCPNASLPVVENGKTVFPTVPQEFAAGMRHMAELGAWGLGGCCGTTPDHIRALLAATADMQPVRRETQPRCVVSGRAATLALGQRPVVIGERLNPTGKPKMKQALRSGDMDTLLAQAVSQLEAGADALDVNVGLPEIDEAAMLPQVVSAVQRVCDQPLQIDTADPAALEAALRVYAGKPIINSVCGKRRVMDEVFPLVARYGGAVVALTLDENGIPDTAQGRLDIARRIIAEAARYGIPKQELLFDALTLTVGADAQAANVTLETLRQLHAELGVMTVLGASNVSFGLPQRPLLNAAFLSMAVGAGLDAAIMNPNDALNRAMFDAAVAISGRDAGFERYLAGYGGDKLTLCPESAASQPQAASGAPAQAADAQPSAGTADPGAVLQAAILRGLTGAASAEATRLMDTGAPPLSVVELGVMPALTEVGRRYEAGSFFLPQLLQSATAAQAAFDAARARMPAARPDGRKVVLATVRGDVHDIGKNIVKVLLQNYGFTVIDLGKDVPPQRVLDAARGENAKLVGLSALMTTTVPAMDETIQLLRRELPHAKIVVGGAVLTADYAARIGADAYAPDAMATVRYAQEVYGE